MKDQSNKLKDLKENSNAVFQEIFGLGAKSAWKKGDTGTLDDQGLLYQDDTIMVTPENHILFRNTGSTIKNPAPGWGDFANLNWESDDLSWLAKAKFNAVSVQIKNKKVDRFSGGRWDDGIFYGRAFIDADFNGGYFNGKKFINSNWNVSPFNFIDGTTNEKETILGISNITNFNQNKFKFNIIAVVPGRKITIQMEDGVVHEITVIKRLDSNDSNFQYRIKNGSTQEAKDVPVKWGIIRGKDKGAFDEMTTFSNTDIPLLFTNIFNLGFKSPITKVVIGESEDYGEVQWSQAEKTQQELATSQESYDLANIPFLGVTNIPGQPIKIPGQKALGKNTVGRVFFNFPSPQHHAIFKALVKALEQGYVKAYFTQIKSALDNNVINGAPVQYPYLANLIGKDEDLNVENIDKNLANSLDWANKFLQNFVDTMVLRVTRAGKQYDIPNKKIKEQVKNSLLAHLGLQQPEEASKTVKKSARTGGAESDDVIKIPEGRVIRTLIRKIISENL